MRIFTLESVAILVVQAMITLFAVLVATRALAIVICGVKVWSVEVVLTPPPPLYAPWATGA